MEQHSCSNYFPNIIFGLKRAKLAAPKVVGRSSAAVAKGCVAGGCLVTWSLLVEKDDIKFTLLLHTADGPVSVHPESRHSAGPTRAAGEFTAPAAGVLVATLTNEMWVHDAHLTLSVEFDHIELTGGIRHRLEPEPETPLFDKGAI